jgi:hypothetical protein
VKRLHDAADASPEQAWMRALAAAAEEAAGNNKAAADDYEMVRAVMQPSRPQVQGMLVGRIKRLRGE